jgi:hypothetical protein
MKSQRRVPDEKHQTTQTQNKQLYSTSHIIISCVYKSPTPTNPMTIIQKPKKSHSAMFTSGMRESWEAEVAIPEGTSYAVFLLLLVWLYTDSLAPEEVSPEMVCGGDTLTHWMDGDCA